MPNLNALNPLVDINSVAQLVAQAQMGGAEISPEEFYSKQLLDTIRLDASQYVYYKLADSMPIQEKADKLTIRRWAPLQGHTVPLAEGVPPSSDKGSVEKYELQAFQYGRYMEFSDRVSFKVVDPIIAHYSKEYSLVAMETLDMLARESLLLVSQKYYANAAAGPDGFTSFALGVPNMTDLRKIVLAMKKSLVKPRNSGKYEVIGSAEFYFDMISDPTVTLYMQYNQTSSPMFNGGQAPLPPMFDMSFSETMCVPTSGEWTDAVGNKRLKIWSGTIAAPVISASTNAPPNLVDLDESVPGEYTLVSGYVRDPRTNMDASYIPDQPTWALPPDTKEFKMQHILIVGKECLARTGLAGQDSAKMYVKPLGSSGVLDPIDQRQSLGFKINSVGFGSTRPEAVYDYVCVPSQVNS